MSRSTSFIGLNPRSEEFIKRLNLKPKPTENEVTGMFDETVWTINEYVEDKIGYPLYIDYVQCEVWSSGPVIFLAIKDRLTNEPVKETLWTDEELNRYL